MPEKKTSRIVIFGASGRVGRLLAGAFHTAGHRLVVVGRRAYALAALPGEAVALDLQAPADNAPIVRAGDLVINAAHARYTSAILKLCPPGTARLIVLGSTRYLSRIPDVKADEVRSAMRALERSDLPWVMLHPTMIYGAEGENNVQRMAALIRRFHIIPLPGGGNALIQPIYIDDVVEAVVRVVARPAIHRTMMDLGGPEAVPYRTLLQLIAEAAGSWVKVVPLPLACLRLAARLTALIPGIPKIADHEVLRLQEDKAVDISAMRDLLDLTPRPLTQGLRATFAGLDNDGTNQR